jgi:uncharacterized membrane protein
MARGKKNSKSKNKNEELDISFNFTPKYFIWFTLIVFLLLGFYMRFYHVSYPVIGYHNWKTSHYITEARNFARDGFFKEGFFVPMRDSMGSFREPSSGMHYDTFPMISIVVGFFFKIFGESLIVARLVNILFSLASVFVFYLLVKELFNKESLALISAFLAAINPLYVFFSHNIQVVNPGLFFMLLGALFFIKWIKSELKTHNYLYIATFSVVLGAITKYTFLVIAIPILYTLPYKKIWKQRKKLLKPLLIAGFIALIFPAWFYYSEFVIKSKFLEGREASGAFKLSNLVDFSLTTDAQFWATMKSYIADNFTLFGITLSMLGGVLLSLLYLTKNHDKYNYKFMFSYFISIFIFVFIMGFKLSGHNYHQFPVAPIIIFLIAFLIEFIGRNISNFFSTDILKNLVYVVVALLVLFGPFAQGKSLFARSMESKDRMFNTQFPGLDVAGYYIRDHSQTNERIFHSSGQSFGVLWHADRKGYKGSNIPDEYRFAEDNLNVSWVFAYQWGIATFLQNPESLNYLQNNYKLVQFAFTPSNNQPLYFLFQKGGTSNLTTLNDQINSHPHKSYTYTRGISSGFLNLNFNQAPYEIRVVDLE